MKTLATNYHLLTTVLYSVGMTLLQTKDLLFFVLAVVALWLGFFICWILYEVARLIRQTNQIVIDTREKIQRVEAAFSSVKEKIESSTRLIAALGAGGKMLSSIVGGREKKKKK